MDTVRGVTPRCHSLGLCYNPVCIYLRVHLLHSYRFRKVWGILCNNVYYSAG